MRQYPLHRRVTSKRGQPGLFNCLVVNVACATRTTRRIDVLAGTIRSTRLERQSESQRELFYVDIELTIRECLSDRDRFFAVSIAVIDQTHNRIGIVGMFV